MTNWRSRATTYVKAYMRERLVWDTFSHDETDSWGNTETTSSTLAWTTSGGAASDFDVASGVGTISAGTVNVNRYAIAGSGFSDVELEASVTIPVVAAGDSINFYLLARVVDTNNYYSFRATFATDGTVDLIMGRVLGGSGTSLGTASDVESYSAGTTLQMRFRCYQTNLGADLKGRVWLSTEDESDEWNLENIVDNTNELLLGGVGVRASLGVANSNTLPVVYSIDDFTAYSAPAWIDTTRAVLIAQGLGQPIQGSIGRATELAQIDETDLNFALKNLNGWFTPDNVLSPYWPDWKTGTPLRWTETIGAKTFAFPDTWLEIPEVSLSFEKADHPEQSDRVLHLNAVDLLTRLKRAPRFVSSLGQYILHEAPSGELVAYWPLIDASGSSYANSVGPTPQDPLRYEPVGAFASLGYNDALISFGAAEGPRADDASVVAFNATFDPATLFSLTASLGSTTVDVDPESADTVTMVIWVYATVEALTDVVWLRSTDSPSANVKLGGNYAGEYWQFRMSTTVGGPSADIQGPAVVTNQWHLLGGQVDFSTGDWAFWVNGWSTSGSVGSGGSDPLTRLTIDGGETDPALRVAHLQVYQGTGFTQADFLAQYNIGTNGYAHQRVDERIRQIANYAGIGDGQLDLEESDSLIQDPAFAGQRPGDLAVAAAATGGGILFTQGDRLVYHDRKHRFNL